MGSTTVPQLRTDLGTLNAFAQSWSSGVQGSLFTSGCPGQIESQEAILALTPDQERAATASCVANGIAPDAGARFQTCLFDTAQDPGMAVTEGAYYRRQALQQQAGTPAPVLPSIGSADGGTARTASPE